MDSDAPPEPPDIALPSEPPEVAMDHTQPSIPPAHSNVVPGDVNDDDSHTTYSYAKILPRQHRPTAAIPAKVHVHAGTTNDTITSSDTQSALPFLTMGSEKALPKYSGRTNDDINEFLYKLRIFLNHLFIDNCHWKNPQ